MRRDPALGWRVLSAAIFLPVLAWLIHTGGAPYEIYASGILVVGLWEFCRMGDQPLPVGLSLLGCAALLAWLMFGVPEAGGPARLGAALLKGRSFFAPGALVASLLWIPVLVLAWRVLRPAPRGAAGQAGRLLLGLGYLGVLGRYQFAIREPRPEAWIGPAAATALAYALTWSADTGAYAVGLRIGRHALHPSVSPGKTWEGAVGGLVLATAVGAVGGTTLWSALGPSRGALLGGMVAVAGQMGDLIESMIKRDYGAKDSASWIPGHGGALDRFDSLLLAMPVVVLYLRSLGPHLTASN